MSIDFYIGRTGISLSFWFFSVISLFLVLDADVLALYLILPVAVHELGHLLVLAVLRVKIRAIKFTATGVDIVKADNRQLSYAKEMAICMAGVLANLLTALGLYFFAFKSLRVMLLISANLAVAAFNALPIGSLDGGALVKAVASRFFTPRLADTVSKAFSFLALTPMFAASIFLLLRPERNFTLLAVCVYLTADIILRG